jgi:hypothetical protein
MRLFPRTLAKYLADARVALQHAPLEIAIGIAVAASFSYFLRQDDFAPWARIAASAALAFPIVFGLSILRRRERITSAQRWAGAALIVLAAAAWGYWVFDPDLGSERWRFLSLLGASVLALSLAPAVGGGNLLRRRFWLFGHILVVRVVVVLLYTMVLFAALAGALAAVISLFELGTPDHLYQDLVGVLFFAFMPWMIVGAVPILAASSEAAPAPQFTRLAGRYLFLPLLVLYLAIILSYVVKVVLTGEVPRNLLSPLVIAAAGFGFLFPLLLQPLVDDEEGSGVARVVRAFPVILLLLVPPAIWAVLIRQAQYGWTEFRYLRLGALLAFGVLAIWGTVRLVRRSRPLLVEIPLLLSALLLISAIGPWSAPAVSERSQQQRLRSALGEADLMDGDRVSDAAIPAASSPIRMIPANLFEKIEGSARYLYTEHGPAALQPLFAFPVERFENFGELIRALHIGRECEPDELLRPLRMSLPPDLALSVPEGVLYRFGETAGTTDTVGSGDGSVELRVADQEITVRRSGTDVWSSRVDLRHLADRLRLQPGSDCGPGPEAPSLTGEDAVFSLFDDDERERGILIVTGATVLPDDGGIRIEHVRGLVVLIR